MNDIYIYVYDINELDNYLTPRRLGAPSRALALKFHDFWSHPPLAICYSLLLKMTIEIVKFPIKHGDL